MIHRYTTLASAALGMQAMKMEELIGYLRSADRPELTPLQSILAQTEALGDPAMPAEEDVAILSWLGVAFEQWESRFPLEQPLLLELRRLKPLAAKLALTDPDFLVPGRHPLHRMMDSLQLAAVGWQARLGRVGEALRKQLFGAVEDALACFDAAGADLAALSARVVAATDQDLARASRMAQRMIETEQGRIRTAEAKRLAAVMINSALPQTGLPPDMGAFLTGPWYESAQLVLLKFGAGSGQWAQMSAITTALTDSVQPIADEEDPARRQHLFKIVSALPRELRRWLLSLQHDGDAVRNAVSMIENLHMQILRKQTLDVEHTGVIPVADKAGLDQVPPGAAMAGQWFIMVREDGEPLRLRLVLKIEDTAELLFANQAGIKVLRQSFDDFAGLVECGRISTLDSGESFSRSLAAAAGIETQEDLVTLLGPQTLQTRQEHQDTRQRGQRQRERAATPDLGTEQAEAEQLQREWDEARRAQALRRESGFTLPGGDNAESTTIDLPMGTWLGFHDGDTPLLAKIAVHDRESNNYIFVNRRGIKVRQLHRRELAGLIRDGMVDILESRSNFRDAIDRAKKTPQH